MFFPRREDALAVELDEAVGEKEKLRFIHAVDPSCQTNEVQWTEAASPFFTLGLGGGGHQSACSSVRWGCGSPCGKATHPLRSGGRPF